MKCPECGAIIEGASYDHDPSCSEFPVTPGSPEWPAALGDSMIETFASDLPAQEASELRGAYRRALSSHKAGSTG